MSVVGWSLLGDRLADSVIDSLCDGSVGGSVKHITNIKHLQAKVVIEILFLLHLVSAFPIVLSPPFQFVEEILNVPKGIFFFNLQSNLI